MERNREFQELQERILLRQEFERRQRALSEQNDLMNHFMDSQYSQHHQQAMSLHGHGNQHHPSRPCLFIDGSYQWASPSLYSLINVVQTRKKHLNSPTWNRITPGRICEQRPRKNPTLNTETLFSKSCHGAALASESRVTTIRSIPNSPVSPLATFFVNHFCVFPQKSKYVVLKMLKSK